MSREFYAAAEKVKNYLTHLDGHGTAADAARSLEIMIKEHAGNPETTVFVFKEGTDELLEACRFDPLRLLCGRNPWVPRRNEEPAAADKV
jgi:hypothetical protein